jgi:PAS domain S-box-containing protein
MTGPERAPSSMPGPMELQVVGGSFAAAPEVPAGLHVGIGEERAVPLLDASFQASVDALEAHVAALDMRGKIVAVNAAWRRFSETEGGGSDFVGSSYLDACLVPENPALNEFGMRIREVLVGNRRSFDAEYECHGPSSRRWFRLHATHCEGGGLVRAVVTHENVTERRLADEHARLYTALFDDCDVAVVVTDVARRVISWSIGAQRLYGWTDDEATGQILTDLIGPRDLESHAESRELVGAESFAGEQVLRRKDGATLPVFVRTRAVDGVDNRSSAVVSVSMDISQRKQTELELIQARNYLRAVADSMVQGMFTLDEAGCVLYVNQVAQDLLGWTAEELLGRPMPALAEIRALELIGTPSASDQIVDQGVCGRAVRDDDATFTCQDGSQLPVAYTASPLAAGYGAEGCVVVFEDITQRKSEGERIKRDLEKLAWVGRIQEALTEQRFVLYAQPIVDLSTGKVVQRELLLRMLTRESADAVPRAIAPGAFLPVAEEYGLIGEIDRWVIDRAVEMAASGVSAELNVSARSVSDPGILSYIAHAIQSSGADPQAMVFEITETAVVSDNLAARGFVEGLHRLGCKVALDDFGTGYGGFTYLKQLPIDYLKIDMEFVRDVRHNPGSQSVVKAIVGLAEGFGLKTVGEGVEDEATLDLLRKLGVDYAQGYHLGRPAPVHDH